MNTGRFTQFRFLKNRFENGILFLRMDNKDNSLSVDFMHELIEVHNRAMDEKEIRAVVLQSLHSGFFSNGLAIDSLLHKSQPEKTKVFETLLNLVITIYGFYKPHLCFLNGHAMAGGAVLAILSDYRIMLNGPYRIGFNENRIGLGMPLGFLKILEEAAGKQSHRRLALFGEFLKPAAALRAGVVDAVEDPLHAEKLIFRKAKDLAEIPFESYRYTKGQIRNRTLDYLHANKDLMLKEFSAFFNETFEKSLKAIEKKQRMRQSGI